MAKPEPKVEYRPFWEVYEKFEPPKPARRGVPPKESVMEALNEQITNLKAGKEWSKSCWWKVYPDRAAFWVKVGIKRLVLDGKEQFSVESKDDLLKAFEHVKETINRGMLDKVIEDTANEMRLKRKKKEKK